MSKKKAPRRAKELEEQAAVCEKCGCTKYSVSEEMELGGCFVCWELARLKDKDD